MAWNCTVIDSAGLIDDHRFKKTIGTISVRGPLGSGVAAFPGSGTVLASGTPSIPEITASGSLLPIDISTIPDFSINVDQTINLIDLYVIGTGTVTDSQVIGIDTNYATYTHAGGLVGVAEGTITGAQLEVTYT